MNSWGPRFTWSNLRINWAGQTKTEWRNGGSGGVHLCNIFQLFVHAPLLISAVTVIAWKEMLYALRGVIAMTFGDTTAMFINGSFAVTPAQC